jgi:hypothetical protein
MNDADIKVKQQIVDKIKSSTNILVTVSNNPSVDDLSAALGLTALLNKLDKHATAIFSGAIPPAITFLDPTKVFENTADSLRDFIIALDKEKADHLRYKVEGDVVKIFITPYHTTINSDDLEFSQGDFNVELVLALGVANQDSLDVALAAHGRILHEVTVATFSAGEQTSRLGSIDWRDESASSLCEMITSISDSLKTDKTLLDKQISTALLTGIVASTDRFSNPRTTSRVMTMAAQLMAAGADQQLIAAQLQESHEINSLPASPQSEEVKVPIAAKEVPVPAEPIVEQSTLPPGSLTIDHDPVLSQEIPAVSTLPIEEITATPDIMPEPVSTATPENESTEEPLPQPLFIDPTPNRSTLAPAYPTEPSFPEPPQALSEGLPQIQNVESVSASNTVEPSLGGTLNATADEAADEMRRELEDQQNKTILTHSYLGDAENGPNVPINGIGQPEDTKDVDIFSEPPMSSSPPSFDLPLPPPLPDFSTLPPPTNVSPLSPGIGEPVTASDLSTLSPLLTTPATDDPGQFKIPGQ